MRDGDEGGSYLSMCGAPKKILTPWEATQLCQVLEDEEFAGGSICLKKPLDYSTGRDRSLANEQRRKP